MVTIYSSRLYSIHIFI